MSEELNIQPIKTFQYKRNRYLGYFDITNKFTGITHTNGPYITARPFRNYYNKLIQYTNRGINNIIDAEFEIDDIFDKLSINPKNGIKKLISDRWESIIYKDMPASEFMQFVEYIMQFVEYISKIRDVESQLYQSFFGFDPRDSKSAYITLNQTFQK